MDFPVWTIIFTIIMLSIVAGVVEEAAIRGYMQKPLEMKYGPMIALSTVAVIFAIIHIPNAFASPVIVKRI